MAAIRGHLLILARRSQSIRALSTSADSDVIAIADAVAAAGKQKLEKLKTPDLRFLKYNSPHPTHTDHTPILSAPLTRVTTLPNGLRVATESTLSSKTATVGVWIDAGYRFESDKTSGTAHFVEHMLFKGTKSRPCHQLVEEIENMGGFLDAFTLKEQTTYYMEVLEEGVPRAIDILADMLQNPRFTKVFIKNERNLILKEINDKVVGHRMEDLLDHLYAAAFKHNPLGRNVLGSVENIMTIKKEDLKNYISTHYTAPRMVIAAAGAVKHEEIVDQVNFIFTKLSTGPTTTSELIAKEPAVFTSAEVKIVRDNVSLAQFAVAFNGASCTDPDSITLMVIHEMLGSHSRHVVCGKHMGSRLVQRLDIDEIAESMMAFNYNFKDTGLFGVYAIAEPDCLEDLACAIMEEMTCLCYEVSEDDVVRARNKLKSSLLLQMKGTFPVVQDIGHQLLTYGRRIPYAELCARIDAVDARTVKRVASRFIRDKDIAIAAIGPVEGLPDYNWFRSRTDRY